MQSHFGNTELEWRYIFIAETAVGCECPGAQHDNNLYSLFSIKLRERKEKQDIGLGIKRKKLPTRETLPRRSEQDYNQRE